MRPCIEIAIQIFSTLHALAGNARFMRRHITQLTSGPAVRGGGRQRSIEGGSLQVHKLVAKKLQKNPQTVLDKARRNIKKWGWDSESRPSPYMIAWKQLLDKPIDQIIKIITSPGEKGTLLRSSSPFEGVLTKAERERTIKHGKEHQS